jgi:hypothetical protein
MLEISRLQEVRQLGLQDDALPEAERRSEAAQKAYRKT